jgi:hypothetical protein
VGCGSLLVVVVGGSVGDGRDFTWFWEVVWVQWRREVASEQFDEPAVLFLLVCVVEHFSVFRGIACSILVAAGLIGAT